MMGPVFYLVSDRRPLRRLIPILASCSLKREIVTCIVVFAVGFLVAGISLQFFPSA